MELIVFESEAYYRLKRELFEEMSEIFFKSKSEHEQLPDKEPDWLKPEAARQLLGIRSKNTLKKYRRSGWVKYTKMGNEYRYSKKSILKYMDSNSNK